MLHLIPPSHPAPPAEDERPCLWPPLLAILVMVLVAWGVWATMGKRANVTDGPRAVWKQVQ